MSMRTLLHHWHASSSLTVLSFGRIIPSPSLFLLLDDQLLFLSVVVGSMIINKSRKWPEDTTPSIAAERWNLNHSWFCLGRACWYTITQQAPVHQTHVVALKFLGTHVVSLGSCSSYKNKFEILIRHQLHWFQTPGMWNLTLRNLNSESSFIASSHGVYRTPELIAYGKSAPSQYNGVQYVREGTNRELNAPKCRSFPFGKILTRPRSNIASAHRPSWQSSRKKVLLSVHLTEMIFLAYIDTISSFIPRDGVANKITSGSKMSNLQSLNLLA